MLVFRLALLRHLARKEWLREGNVVSRYSEPLTSYHS